MAKITDAQIKNWKNTWGDVYQIDVTIVEGDIATAYFRKPDLNIIAAASLHSEDNIKSGLILFENCWLGGDDRIQKSDEAKLAATIRLAPLFKIPEASIKKL